jgi:hypothetical protein
LGRSSAWLEGKTMEGVASLLGFEEFRRAHDPKRVT